MMLNEYLLIVNAVVCMVTVFRLLAYQRKGAMYRPLAALYAYALIIASGSVSIRILTGDYFYADWSETLINATVCIAVIAARGNVMRLALPSRKNKDSEDPG